MALTKKDKWYCAGLHFECSQCGNCCGGFPGYVWMTPEEAERIAEFLKLDKERFLKEYTTRVRWRVTLVEKENYDCVFLQRDGEANAGKCGIYSVRPQQCRTWPFWKSNLKSPDTWNAQVKRCSGINRGEAHTVEEIEKTRDTSPC